VKRLPDAVLLDINLGAENGLDLVAWMRQKPEMSEIPVIAVTAHALALASDRAGRDPAGGLQSVPVEPINFQLLRKELNRWLQDRTVSRPNS
jgi:two-component system, sensor histidine kinase and response regulator